MQIYKLLHKHGLLDSGKGGSHKNKDGGFVIANGIEVAIHGSQPLTGQARPIRAKIPEPNPDRVLQCLAAIEDNAGMNHWSLDYIRHFILFW
jgi:hypothetical protein